MRILSCLTLAFTFGCFSLGLVFGGNYSAEAQEIRAGMGVIVQPSKIVHNAEDGDVCVVFTVTYIDPDTGEKLPVPNVPVRISYVLDPYLKVYQSVGVPDPMASEPNNPHYYTCGNRVKRVADGNAVMTDAAGKVWLRVYFDCEYYRNNPLASPYLNNNFSMC